MSALAVDSQLNKAYRFLEATIGKKVLMALTGVMLFGFVVGHLLGNLQIYQGREKLDAYAAFLHEHPQIVWPARIGLLLAVGVHIWCAVSLYRLKVKARPVAYVKKEALRASYAARTMYWSGPILASFVVYHLLHFTVGSVHPNFVFGSVYNNVVTGFQHPAVSVFYILSMVLLGMHLNHGLWSMFQSLGIDHPRYTPWFKRFAAAFSFALAGGNISIPIAVMAGLIRL